MKLTFLEAPICKGSPTDGSQFAFGALCENGLAAHFDGAALWRMEPPAVDEEAYHPSRKDCTAVMTVSRLLAERVAYVRREGSMPIVIGGDHSVAIGSIAGISAVYGAEALTVIYIDGHTDINTEQTTETGFIHGMPLAAAMGLCHESLTVGRKRNLYGKNTVILGARSIDPGEYGIIEAQGVTLYTADQIRARGMEAVMHEVLARIQTPVVHVSFDVDVMDETEFSSTGYRMPNGLTLDEAEAMLTAVLATGAVASLDFVEYNPLLDQSGKDRETVFRLLSHLKTYYE
ncbi:MAG: arginase [Ruminococcaceae bacterium]|nr:arginase [Oscillospiraceae bacterium]